MPIMIRAHMHFPWCGSPEEQTTALLRAQAYLRTYQGRGMQITLTASEIEGGWEVVDNPRGRDVTAQRFRNEVDELLSAAWVHSSRVGTTAVKALATTEPEYSGEIPVEPPELEPGETLVWEKKDAPRRR